MRRRLRTSPSTVVVVGMITSGSACSTPGADATSSTASTGRVPNDVKGPWTRRGATQASAPTLSTVFATSTRKLFAMPVRSSAIANTTPAPTTAMRNCRKR